MTVAACRKDFTVSADGTDIDLGTLVLARTQHAEVGAVAPEFQCDTLDGKSLRLSDFHGKYVLLDFWNTRSEWCVAELPKLKAAYSAGIKDGRLAIIGLTLDRNLDAVKQYVAKNKLMWDQISLDDIKHTSVADDYELDVPTLWLIGPDGKVIAKNIDPDELQAKIAAAMGTPK